MTQTHVASAHSRKNSKNTVTSQVRTVEKILKILSRRKLRAVEKILKILSRHAIDERFFSPACRNKTSD
jgi:hypothetical protein